MSALLGSNFAEVRERRALAEKWRDRSFVECFVIEQDIRNKEAGIGLRFTRVCKWTKVGGAA